MAATITLLIIAGIVVIAVFWFFRLAPPSVITITSGPPGSAFETNAFKYKNILSRNGVTLRILPSQGSQENLQRLHNMSVNVDIGFVQGGISNAIDSGKVVSLGSVSYEPLLIFYRAEEPITLLSQFKGKRLAIGPVGSGTHTLSLALLKYSGIEPGGSTTLLDPEADAGAKALQDGTADALFVTSDSASASLMRKLLLQPDIRFFNFTQADAYTRRISYLNKLELPMGSLDFGQNIPKQDVFLVGPTVELLARSDLHPALCDLVLEAAREIHGGSGLLRRKGEFPAPLEHDYAISSEALRYYKSGKSFLYRTLPFWLASMLNRVLLVFVPAFVVLIPAMRVVPTMLRFKTRLKFYRWYRAMLVLESELRGELPAPKREDLLLRLDEIEKAVNRMKVPASFADQFYSLRGHIEFLREKLHSGFKAQDNAR